MTSHTFQLKEHEWQKMNATRNDASLMTPIGIAEGDMLFYLEQKGTAYLGDMATHLEWPKPVMMLAAGALIRNGLIKARRYDNHIVLERSKNAHARNNCEQSDGQAC